MRLYLDFDGVIHRAVLTDSYTAVKNGHFKTLDDGGKLFWAPTHFEHVKALAAVVNDFPSVQIYVHSTWRFIWNSPRPNQLADWLGPLGPHFMRLVPPNILAAERVDVIKQDMALDGYEGEWLAIDDEDSGFTATGETARFIKTATRVGLTPENLADLRKRLGAMVLL